MIYRLLRPLLFLLPAEFNHWLALRWLNWRYSNPHKIQKKQSTFPCIPNSVLGIQFPNPIGLAAGFDKNGDCVDSLFALGFGFIELGTVTPLPQAGNSRPRLFRLPKYLALVNRMGFNNKGVDHLVKNLKNRKVNGIVGINIGKNATTPLEDAVNDYIICLKAVYCYADYIVINISSPNTPRLRELYTDHYLPDLLSSVSTVRNQLVQKYVRSLPILLKLTVDMPADSLDNTMSLVRKYNIDGIVTSNTTISRDAVDGHRYANEAGGLSGSPLTLMARARLKHWRELAGTNMTIISVGGIMDTKEVCDRLSSGANLIQMYTGLIYEGPDFVKKLLRSIVAKRD